FCARRNKRSLLKASNSFGPVRPLVTVADDDSRWRVPVCAMAVMPRNRMGPPLRSFAADAHGCIMVRVLGPTGYKVVARLIAPASGLPSDRHPDRTKRAVVLEAVKVWPGNGGACRKVGATANLDSFCARRRERSAGRDE